MNDLLIQSLLKQSTRPYFFWLTLILYWLLVMGMWGIYAFDRGLPFETSFPMNCQYGLRSCLVYLDDLRPYNSLFLGLAHLLGGANGSYVTSQLLYGFLWWGRGVLTFLIFSRIWSAYPIAPFIMGVLVIVHASDNALNFIGQIHQFGFMFFLVLSVYLLIEGWYAKNLWKALILIILSIPALYISLWTYESHYFIILIIPLVLLALRPKFDKKFVSTSLIWYGLPAIYGYLQLKRYTTSEIKFHQNSIARPDISFGAIAKDWLIHLQQSTHFWQWGEIWKWGDRFIPSATSSLATAIALICTFGFLIGAYLLFEHHDRQELPSPKSLWICFGIGLLILILSFPIYVLIRGNTAFWRTQMLSGFGAASVIGSILLLLAHLLPKGIYRVLFVLVACAIVVFKGVQTGVTLQAVHEQRWKIHQQVMVQVSELIPDVKDNTLILLTNMPSDRKKDGFGGALWFDFPIQLLYPGRQLVGYFIYENGQHAKGNPWVFTETGMQWQKKGIGQELEQVKYSEIIALRYNQDGSFSILEKFPNEVLPESFDTGSYNPQQRLIKTFELDSSIRMFAR